MTELNAVIFDLDDTLYPEREYVLGGFQAVAQWSEVKFAIPAADSYAKLLQLFHSSVQGDTFDRWLTFWELPHEELVPQLVELYRSHEPTIAPFSDVPPILASLKQRYRLGLLSDGHLKAQQRKLEALNVASYFDVIVFSDQWGRKAWKPNSKPFEEILGSLQAEPSQAVYVADNPLKDFLGANKAGLWSIRFRHKAGVYCQLEPETPKHAPHIEIQEIRALEEALKALPTY